MTYLLDTCVCVDLMRGKLPTAREIMSRCDPAQFGIPAIVVAELEFGIEKSADPAKNRLLTERFLAPFEIVPFNGLCARAYGPIREHLRRAGTPIGPNDLLIAATAIAMQATLVSNNTGEFGRVPGLRLESWHETAI